MEIRTRSGNYGLPKMSLLSIVLLLCATATGQNLDRETAVSRLCSTDKGLIHCPVIPLSSRNVSLEGLVHACTVPLYIQFRVKVNNVSISEHTFINDDESQLVRGLETRVMLRVVLHRSDGYIFIKAGFLEEGYKVYFLETHLDQPDDAQCSNADESSGRVLPVALVGVASVVVATAAALLLLWWYRRRQKAALAVSELLSDMEGGGAYQEEPITAHEVTGARTTVIQNQVYRDSLVVLEPIAEEGNGQQQYRRQNSNGGRQAAASAAAAVPSRKRGNGNRRNRNNGAGGGGDLVDISDDRPKDLAREDVGITKIAPPPSSGSPSKTTAGSKDLVIS